MKLKRGRTMYLGFFILGVVFLFGCQNVIKRRAKPKTYAIPHIEAGWIRDGEPLKFEEELWYPMDSVENLLDSEVYMLGEYRGVEFFVEKIDVRPFDRLYTKFAKNKFRTFKRRRASD